ncbi:hypothetical protein HPB49_000674 [Dermacentor silvarum]|uniref:Uncharacterized protein n=1 Tax=Dermacentor silvarum TaxID=543639 RepID=A0ACB8CNN8_DERSI|nr:uncharacterized protein LOC119454461 [Dermacentor silvarum]KAH7948673.1 hypothetical protein HPB49_000674 [Dermacentor silvarum]
MEPVERRSKVNFTEEERNVLVDLVSKYSSVLECKQTDAVSVHAKKKAWEKLTEEFNCRHNVRPRTSKQLKKCWDNLKEKWHRAKAEDTREIFKTGGGTPADSNMNEELQRVGAVASHMATRLQNPFDSDRTGPGTETTTPAVAALLASSQPGRSTDVDDADMQCENSCQWDLPHSQDEEPAIQCTVPQNGDPAQLAQRTPPAPSPPGVVPTANLPAVVLPAAVPRVPIACHERRTNASRPSCSRNDAVTSELGARLAAITKDARQKRKEHLLRMKLLREDHELRTKLARDEHNDRLQKREAEHAQQMENLKAKKVLLELKIKLLNKQNE